MQSQLRGPMSGRSTSCDGFLYSIWLALEIFGRMTTCKPCAQVTAAAARIVGAEVPPGTPLMQAGMDSLGAVELRRELAAALGELQAGSMLET